MTPTDAVILSDLHLGSRVCQAKAIVDFLDAIYVRKVRTRRLILNGDVFDSIDFRRLKKSHWKVLSLLRELSGEIEVTWVCGNHDGSAEIVSQLLGLEVVDEIVVPSGDKKVLVLHGHQFDRTIERHPVASRWADRLYRLMQTTRRTYALARRMKRRSKLFLRSTELIRAGAVGRAAELGCDAVCCGHTHLPVAFADDPLPYFNSGCWTEAPCHYLTLTAGVVELHAYPPDQSMGETQEIPIAETAG